MVENKDATKLHKVVFEMLDKELRRIPSTNVMHAIVEVDESSFLEKDIYPFTENLERIVKRYELGNKFVYEGTKSTVFFNVVWINAKGQPEQDENTQRRDGVKKLSVIVMK